MYAEFLDEEDRLPFLLAASLYDRPITIEQGYEMALFGNQHCRAWVNGTDVIIGIRGTAILASGGISDLIDDVTLSGSAETQCSLNVVRIAQDVYNNFIGDYRVIVCGHSLGGAASFCIARENPGVVRAISFNGAAPPLGGPHIGAGIERSKAYHIVGDIISAYTDNETCDVRRIKLIEEYTTNWFKVAYYHSTERFRHAHQYEIWTAQQEQDDIQNYVYHSTLSSTITNLLIGVVTKRLHRDRIREFVCSHPIPGSQSSGQCKLDLSYKPGPALGVFGGGVLGYILGGAIASSPLGAVATGASVGYKLARGEGLLDQFVDSKLVGHIRKRIKYS